MEATILMSLRVGLIVSLTKQANARFLDALPEQFTVRPTSRGRFFDENCDKLTELARADAREMTVTSV